MVIPFTRKSEGTAQMNAEVTQAQWANIKERVSALLLNENRHLPGHMRDEHSYRTLAFGIVGNNFKQAALAGIMATDKAEYSQALQAIQLCEKLQEAREWL